MSGRLDETSKAFRSEVEAIILKYSGGDPVENHRRWGQLKRWGRRETRGSAKRRDRLRNKIFEEQGRRCAHCGESFRDPKGLHLHRINKTYHADKAKYHGYFRENVTVICSDCHEDVDSE